MTITITALPPHEGIFYDGQIFDAYQFAVDIVKSAKKSIVVIDNYIDETVLTILSKRNKNVSAIIYTRSITKQLQLDLKMHNKQYEAVEIKTFNKSHDRFIIIDHVTVFHIGASLKDLGKKPVVSLSNYGLLFQKSILMQPKLLQSLSTNFCPLIALIYTNYYSIR